MEDDAFPGTMALSGGAEHLLLLNPNGYLSWKVALPTGMPLILTSTRYVPAPSPFESRLIGRVRSRHVGTRRLKLSAAAGCSETGVVRI